ncbi:hypothetical protein L1887_23486 [Cichorium endivia]|nr:hypothetical protein L1887_23486 [Cichorium endivia]
MKLKLETRKPEWDSVVVDQSETYGQDLVSFLKKSERIMEKTAFSKFMNNPSDPVLLDEDDSDSVRTIPKKISAMKRKKILADAEFKIVDRLKRFS